MKNDNLESKKGKRSMKNGYVMSKNEALHLKK
jgi:hypothetical protein